MVNIKDIAKACGVGVSTVSYALNDSSELNLKTKKRIQEKAREMGYVPNAFARSLKNKKSFNIGVFITDFAGPIHPTILNGMTPVFADSEYQMLVTFADLKMTLIKDRTVDLAILMDPRIKGETVNELRKICPIILYDSNLDYKNVHRVILQNEKAIYDETKYILNKGVKKIAFILGPKSSIHNAERFSGFKKALMEANLFDESLVYDADSFLEKDGYKLMDSLLNETKTLPFEALVCANDELAIGAMVAMYKHGFKVPKDCLVCGFDNSEKASLVQPPLTTIDVNWLECGKTIANLALDILANKEVKHTTVIPADLIIRLSTEKEEV